ncbi:cadmium-translocating P-type ATPase [Flavobacterium sp. XN-5]|jgi:heavy metal translocating P-type ATPase|uniref:P-type Zn(2+) transporter n=3 Tax=Flavobacterium TaxID=237 RepID=A0A4R5AQF7_9FLAO|nr:MULTISPECIES: cation-translocating P-type ATPase [Flavobacterium]MBC5841650.1 cadmium-translocating P-type ATPase [Flavobacterium kayseriense]MBC5848178.1 cadmium-translocating P-type ATPase [Flavobacterium kayseriense]NGY37756.1 cadmium-translocating P-type ATPase [Flavobacterium sp. XN-5]RBN50594.1 cadmium-translocating P-type ATPase [Flavobacterium psychrolimnae]TDD73959.1 cadmium-translocating P-type ATPase [Flavobacterium caseinilyticum]
MNYTQTFFSRQFLWEIVRIITVGIACLLFYFDVILLPILIAAMAFGLYSLVKTAVLDIIKERKTGTELFITIAVIISVLGKEYLAGAVVLMIILIAEYIASASTEKARASIKELIGSVPKTAIVKKDNQESVVQITDLKIGDIVLVKAGEKIPVDGKVIGGSGSVNQAPITGESVPQEKTAGSEAFAGTILELGALDIEMTKAGLDTVFSRIIALVEEAESQQAPIEKFTDKVASWLIPVVFIFVGTVYFFTRDVKLVIALLIFTSPAELGLATPLVTIAAIARAAREGILIKGGLFLEELAKVTTIVFDKTGTLTVGSPIVNTVEIIDPAYNENQLVQFAANVDRRSSHPLAKAILSYADQLKLTYGEPENFEVVKGRGVSAKIDGKSVLLGNKLFMEESKVPVSKSSENSTDTAIYLSVDNKLACIFYISDAIREGAKEMIEGLRKSGIENIIMLTGDNPETAKHVANQIGITDYRANLLPEDKINIIKELQKEGSKVAMVGDGINDAPALVQANIGIAMGAMGTEAAMEAADIVLMQDKLEKIAKARAISKRAYRTIRENIFVGVGVVHVIGITLVLLKIIGPIEAAAIHLLPDTLVFINSVKLLRVKIDA